MGCHIDHPKKVDNLTHHEPLCRAYYLEHLKDVGHLKHVDSLIDVEDLKDVGYLKDKIYSLKIT